MGGGGGGDIPIVDRKEKVPIFIKKSFARRQKVKHSPFVAYEAFRKKKNVSQPLKGASGFMFFGGGGFVRGVSNTHVFLTVPRILTVFRASQRVLQNKRQGGGDCRGGHYFFMPDWGPPKIRNEFMGHLRGGRE